jgi:hypothetical protein
LDSVKLLTVYLAGQTGNQQGELVDLLVGVRP